MIAVRIDGREYWTPRKLVIGTELRPTFRSSGRPYIIDTTGALVWIKGIVDAAA